MVDAFAFENDLCTCGFARGEHEEIIANRPHRRSTAFPPQAFLVRGKNRLKPHETVNPTFGSNQVDLEHFGEDDEDLRDETVELQTDRGPFHGACSLRGRRQYMEDAHAIIPVDNASAMIFAVFDGHGGAQCAQYCAARAHLLLHEELANAKLAATVGAKAQVADRAVRAAADKKGKAAAVVLEEEESPTSKMPKPTRLSAAAPGADSAAATSRRRVSLRNGVTHVTVGISRALSQRLGRPSGGGDVKFAPPLGKGEVEQGLVNAFRKLDSSFCELALEKGWEDGATGTMLYLDPETNTFHLAAAGDSRAVLVTPTGVQALSVDHDPNTNAEERARIVKSRGARGITFDEELGIYRVVGRLGGKLGVTRALGDVYFKPYVTATPETQHGPLPSRGTEAVVVLASDGLWGTVSNEETAEVVREMQKSAKKSAPDLGAAAKRLARMALERGGDDNITVIVVDLHRLVARATRSRAKSVMT
jgi:serine/threonine protein phosphatase PrpC